MGCSKGRGVVAVSWRTNAYKWPEKHWIGVAIKFSCWLFGCHFAIGAPTLVEAIKLRMYEMGLTQKTLANLLGIKQNRINEIISGKKEPTYNIAQNISKKLDIDASIVLGVC